MLENGRQPLIALVPSTLDAHEIGKRLSAQMTKSINLLYLCNHHKFALEPCGQALYFCCDVDHLLVFLC